MKLFILDPHANEWIRMNPRTFGSHMNIEKLLEKHFGQRPFFRLCDGLPYHCMISRHAPSHA
jgi:hypothetical protein